MRNSIQRFLQSSRLNFAEIPREKEKLIEKLKAKYDSPSSPEASYFGKLESFLNSTSQSAREHYNSRSNIEIEVAFDIPEHLMEYTAMDPTAMPAQEEALAN